MGQQNLINSLKFPWYQKQNWEMIPKDDFMTQFTTCEKSMRKTFGISNISTTNVYEIIKEVCES